MPILETSEYIRLSFPYHSVEMEVRMIRRHILGLVVCALVFACLYFQGRAPLMVVLSIVLIAVAVVFGLAMEWNPLFKYRWWPFND